MNIRKERVYLFQCQILTNLFFKSVKMPFSALFAILKNMNDKKTQITQPIKIISALNDPFRHERSKRIHINIAFPTTKEKKDLSMLWKLQLRRNEMDSPRKKLTIRTIIHRGIDKNTNFLYEKESINIVRVGP